MYVSFGTAGDTIASTVHVKQAIADLSADLSSLNDNRVLHSCTHCPQEVYLTRRLGNSSYVSEGERFRGSLRIDRLTIALMIPLLRFQQCQTLIGTKQCQTHESNKEDSANGKARIDAHSNGVAWSATGVQVGSPYLQMIRSNQRPGFAQWLESAGELTCATFPQALTNATAAALFILGRSMVLATQAMTTAFAPWPPAIMSTMAKYRAPVLRLADPMTKPAMAIVIGSITWKDELRERSAE
jgi:hypothetical protein